MIGGKKIHEEWIKRNKKMKLVLVLQSEKELEKKELAKCAKEITNKLGLETIKLKKKTEYPVWIQEVKLFTPLINWGDNDDDEVNIYYLVFLALKDNINELTLNNLKNVECLKGLTDVSSKKKHLIKKVEKYIKKHNATNNYVSYLQVSTTNTNLNPNAPAWTPKQSGGYVKLSNGKTRKVRTYKNGTKYILLNGKKVSV